MPSEPSHHMDSHPYGSTSEKRPAKSSASKSYKNFPYWIFPLVGAAVWFSMLWSMMLIWISQRQPRYSSMSCNHRVAYISDIGANILKPFFVAACATTAVSFSASLLCVPASCSWGTIGHNHAITGDTEKLYDNISVISGITGSSGLVALAIFDTARRHDLHFFCLLIFMGGIILSAASTTYEYSHLGKAFVDFEILRVIYLTKLILVSVEIALSIFFIGAMLGKWYMAASITEWAIAYIYTFYLLSFFFDLSPSARTKDEAEIQRELNSRIRHAHNSGPTDAALVLE